MAAVELFWLPLGAGGHSVRLNGLLYEALMAARERRPRLALYHAALRVTLPEGRYVVEQAPVPDARGSERGVVVEGPVGTRRAGRLRLFRYEIRVWADGEIPDIAEAVDSPRNLSDDDATAHKVIGAVREVPPLVWGRDERGTGEMWNSNAVIAWVLSRAGIDAAAIAPPAGGRAPGWRAGLTVARRSNAEREAEGDHARPADDGPRERADAPGP
jgi:hypothetical protein